MKAKLTLDVGLLLAALSFSLQNSVAVDAKFLAWKLTASLVLVIFATLAAGLIGSGAVSSALRIERGDI